MIGHLDAIHEVSDPAHVADELYSVAVGVDEVDRRGEAHLVGGFPGLGLWLMRGELNFLGWSPISIAQILLSCPFGGAPAGVLERCA